MGVDRSWMVAMAGSAEPQRHASQEGRLWYLNSCVPLHRKAGAGSEERAWGTHLMRQAHGATAVAADVRYRVSRLGALQADAAHRSRRVRRHGRARLCCAGDQLCACPFPPTPHEPSYREYSRFLRCTVWKLRTLRMRLAGDGRGAGIITASEIRDVFTTIPSAPVAVSNAGTLQLLLAKPRRSRAVRV